MKRSLKISLVPILLFLSLLNAEGVAPSKRKEACAGGRRHRDIQACALHTRGPRVAGSQSQDQVYGVLAKRRKRAETRNSGAFDEIVGLEGKAATVKIQFGDDPCTIKLEFRPGKVTVEQSGSLMGCGFGFNVEPDGTYVKVSSKPPKL